MTKTQARATLARLAANTAIQAVINEFDTLGEAEHYVSLQERPQAARRHAIDNADAYADTDYEASDRAEKALAIKALGGSHLPWYQAVQTAIANLTAGTVASIGYSRVSKAEWAREGARVDYARAEVLAWETEYALRRLHAQEAATQPLGRLDAQLVGATYSGTDTPVLPAARALQHARSHLARRSTGLGRYDTDTSLALTLLQHAEGQLAEPEVEGRVRGAWTDNEL
jgi:hypothetical protein